MIKYFYSFKMKNIIFIIFYLALILEINGNFLRNLKEENPPEPPSGDEPPQPPSDQPGPSPSGGNEYNYTDYKATSINENLEEGWKLFLKMLMKVQHMSLKI